MRFKLTVYNIMDPGQRKDALGNPHQEDSIYPDFDRATADDRLFVLCDGMGGHDAGEVASALVCESMSKSILESTTPEGDFTPAMYNQAIDGAFAALDAKDTGAMRRMGTTMTMLKLYKNGAVISHMGDSRVYHIRPGKDAKSTSIIHVTSDHSLVNEMVKLKIITEAEARVNPQKNVITRAMQPHLEHRPEADVIKIRDIRPGDYFYMCSDGMLERMSDDEIKAIFSAAGGDNNNKIKTLTWQTRNNRDNHTAFVIHITDVIDPLSDDAQLDEFDHLCLISSDKAYASLHPDTPDDDSADDDADTDTEPAVDEAMYDNAAEPTNETDTPLPARSGSKKTWLVVLAIILVLIAICAAALYLYAPRLPFDLPDAIKQMTNQ